MPFELVETWGAAIAAIVGGMGVKIVDKLLSKRSETFIESSKIREELREQIELLRKEIDSVKEEAEAWKRDSDEWREKYWAQVEENVRLISQHATSPVDLSTSGSLQ